MSNETNDQTMSRRNALRAMMTGALAMAAAPLLNACNSGKSECNCNETKTSSGKRIVFYFTGTGNSLYVARQLSTEIYSIPQLLKSNQLEFEADEIGIVYPVYWQLPPKIVQEFLTKAKLQAKYYFCIATYGNCAFNAAELFDDIAQKAGHHFNFVSTLLMVDNWIPMYDMDSEVIKEKKEDLLLSYYIKDIEAHRNWIEPATEEQRAAHLKSVEKTGGNIPKIDASEAIIIKSNCRNCGHCIGCCPRGNINKTPEGLSFSGDCELCLACVHDCPHKALSVKYGDVNPNARYRHKGIKPADIIQSNSQKG